MKLQLELYVHQETGWFVFVRLALTVSVQLVTCEQLLLVGDPTSPLGPCNDPLILIVALAVQVTVITYWTWVPPPVACGVGLLSWHVVAA